MTQRTVHAMLAFVLLTTLAYTQAAYAQGTAPHYPPLSEYLMERDAEIALAKSAAPANVSEHATIKLLTKSGYEVGQQGTNGAVCMVLRGFSAPSFTPAMFRDLVYDPTVRSPICFTKPAAATAMPYYELRAKLAIAGKTPDEIGKAVLAAYAKGELPKRQEVTFAYMWSAHQHLAPSIGAWHPHVMMFAPNYDNSMVGGNEFGSPLPQVTDDAGTPFAVVVIPVDDKLAVKMGGS